MEPFHEIVNRIRWTPEPMADYVVGFAERFSDTCEEMPLQEFLASDYPHHRARYLRRKGVIVWDRRPREPGRTTPAR